ncbi:hypothetical protein [Paraburkholderia mimosarum]|uniref:hypothetical protein n=1 Tax=Paraburkholderia mimosarum TaxID=312026 RepID=UPI00041D5E59|nr:hypothetical protein [Paraburkholderia mimosarum]
MDLKALLAGMVGTLESLAPFVRDDGANYHAELKNNLTAAVGVAEAVAQTAEVVAPAAAPEIGAVLGAIEALGSHLADLTAIVHDVHAAVTRTAPVEGAPVVPAQVETAAPAVPLQAGA